MQYDKSVVNQLKHIEDQIRDVLNMIEQNKDYQEVVTQLSASRSAVDRTIGLIVSMNLELSVRENIKNGINTEDVVKEAADLLVQNKENILNQ